MTDQLRDAMLTGQVLEAREYMLKAIEECTPWKGAIQVRDSYNEVWYTVTDIEQNGVLKVEYKEDGMKDIIHAEGLSFDQMYQIAIGI